MEQLRSGDIKGALQRYSDLLLAALIVSVVGMMIVPLPTFLLDLLISLNITMGVVLLMISIYVSDATRIASFPTILLITTLFRLGLNVSSTRLILLQADAGEVVRAFGNFVVQGNFVVGAIIFLIITLIQFIVISKGSERVAEVAARFTLDAMPGKQMSIDADLRSGNIDQDTARRRRSALQRESQLYGSMDGAMKFVKGDAIAGIIITVVNIVGGLIIGVVQRGMDAGEALEVYGLLTIGDGLVSQIPALVISTSAGLIVTRVASEEEGSDLGREIASQILAQPKAIAIAATLLFLLGLVPGLPTVPFFILAAASGGVAYSLLKRPKEEAVSTETSHDEDTPRPPADAPTAAFGDEPVATGVVPVAIELSEDLAADVGLDVDTGGTFVSEIVPRLRRTLYAELGVLLPSVRVRKVIGLPAGNWRLRLSEVPIVEGTLVAGRMMTAEPPDRMQLLGIEAEPVVHPITRQPASWVPVSAREIVEQAGVRSYDPAAVVELYVTAALKQYAFELIGIQEAQALLDSLEQTHPALVREVVPKIVAPQLFADILRRLVEEQVSVRDLRAVLGGLAEWGKAEKDPVLLTEYVRAALRRQLTFQYAHGGRNLSVYLLDSTIEEAIRGAITKTQTGSYLALEPDLSNDILQAIRQALADRNTVQPPVLLTNMEIRRFVKRLVEIEHPNVAVLSFQELVSNVNIQPVGRIAVGV